MLEHDIESSTANILTHPSSEVAASLVESGDQQTLVTFALSEKGDDDMRHSGTSIFGFFSSTAV